MKAYHLTKCNVFIVYRRVPITLKNDMEIGINFLSKSRKFRSGNILRIKLFSPILLITESHWHIRIQRSFLRHIAYSHFSKNFRESSFFVLKTLNISKLPHLIALSSRTTSLESTIIIYLIVQKADSKKVCDLSQCFFHHWWRYFQKTAFLA